MALDLDDRPYKRHTCDLSEERVHDAPQHVAAAKGLKPVC